MAKSKQLKFEGVSGWGGVRRGAGRPNLSGTVNHMERPGVSLKTPLHITLRLREALPSLRNKQLFKEFKKSVSLAKKHGLFVIHFSVQSNHIHLLAEASGNKSLTRGMRSLNISLAKAIKRYCGQRHEGMHKEMHKEATWLTRSSAKPAILKGRYHLHVLKTPREVKNALEYVLLNLSKHQKLIEYIDSYSSGKAFKHWKSLLGNRFRSLIKFDSDFYDQEVKNDLAEILNPPRSWLASVGWLRAMG